MPQRPRPATARGEATRSKLLDAAEHEFGENGFHAASVASITRRAGVAQGTFYLYFASKEEAMRELVAHMGHALRSELSHAIAGAAGRMEAERRGFEAFVRFALAHDNLYRVVMESQFVDEAVYRDYYRRIADGYARGLEAAQQRGEIRAGDPESQAWALMGIAHFLGLRAIWAGGEPDATTMDAAFDVVRHGLDPVSQRSQALATASARTETDA